MKGRVPDIFPVDHPATDNTGKMRPPAGLLPPEAALKESPAAVDLHLVMAVGATVMMVLPIDDPTEEAARSGHRLTDEGPRTDLIIQLQNPLELRVSEQWPL